MRVALIDPAAYTLPYDHELARALAARGHDVTLIASRFRFGTAPEPDGYTRRELFYPLSSRLFGRSPLRLPVKATEHAVGLLRLRHVPCDVRHVQWAPLPLLDAHLLPAGPDAVITAHDVLPRRTANRLDLWRSLYGRFARVIVHSDNGRTRLRDEVRIPEERIVVIPHPVLPGTVRHDDDGQTLLFFGLIQPYKQLDHAVEVARRLGARLVVAGDPLVDVTALQGTPNVEWRLGYQSEQQIDELLAHATVTLFPYRPELDQSGALLRALGSGGAVAAYDAAGIAEPVRRYGAGVVAPQDDLDALTAGIRQLLERPERLAAAREGARRAIGELTWAAAAAAHETTYSEMLR